MDAVAEVETFDVFLSYNRADAEPVRRIQSRLTEAGLATFLDRDCLPAGQPWLPRLEQAIAHSRAVAVLVGPTGLGAWQQREVQLALDRQAEAERARGTFPVIPVLLPRVEVPQAASCACRPGSTCAAISPIRPSSTCCWQASAAAPRPRTRPCASRSAPTAACCRSGRRTPACS